MCSKDLTLYSKASAKDRSWMVLDVSIQDKSGNLRGVNAGNLNNLHNAHPAN